MVLGSIFSGDESGRGGDWVFVLITARSTRDLALAINRWRRAFFGPGRKGKHRKAQVPHEYHDLEAPEEQRAFVLDQLEGAGVKAWAVLKKGYDPKEYPYAIADLLLMAGVRTDDVVLLDERDDQKRRLDHRTIIQDRARLQTLHIEWVKSVERKEIQACDALAGAISRSNQYTRGACTEIVERLLTSPLTTFERDRYRRSQSKGSTVEAKQSRFQPHLACIAYSDAFSQLFLPLPRTSLAGRL